MKAVYYCRVSTDEESQVNALQNQIQEAEDCIRKNKWIKVDSYIDEGRSATQTKTRDEYNRLMNDIETDKFDILIIKSQDRLNRNTKDWYIFIDKLVTNNKKLYIYIENKFYTPDDSIITGIKAILAEEFSRELSKKINNAHRNRQAKGTNVVITSATWGYDKINKEVVVNEKEADIVRLIYDLYIEGYGSRTISKELSNRGIKNRAGNNISEGTIRQIIRNPLFKGTAVMNKVRKDFNTKKTIRNPESEWIYHENAVPAIISNEIWEQANRMMDKKSDEVYGKEFSNRRIGKNLGKYNLSSKIICGECGSVYWRRYRKNIKKEQVVDWSCSEYISRGRKKIKDTRGKLNLKVETKDGGCDNIHLKEEDLNNTLLELSKFVFKEKKDDIFEKGLFLLQNIFSGKSILEEKKQLELEKGKIIKQKDLLLDKLLENIISDDDYKKKIFELEQRLLSITEKQDSMIEKVEQLNQLESRVYDLKNFLYSNGDDAINAEKLVEHIDKIVVNKNQLEVYLDFYQTVLVNFDKFSGEKTYQFVATTKYLIPHTDKYRYNGMYKEVKVKICI